MNRKQKIRTLKVCVNSKYFARDYFQLPSSLREEASIMGIKKQVIDYIRELEREEKDKEITQIQKQQTNILKEQKIFTKILALATFLLSIVAFFSFFDISIASIGLPTQNIFSQIFFAMLTGFGFFILVMAFFLLIFEIIKLFSKK